MPWSLGKSSYGSNWPGYQAQEITPVTHAEVADNCTDYYDQLSCEVCNKADDEHVLLQCDTCHRLFHTHCMQLPALPAEQAAWNCRHCELQDTEHL